MPKKVAGKTYCNFYLSVDVHKALKAYSRTSHLSCSQLIDLLVGAELLNSKLAQHDLEYQKDHYALERQAFPADFTDDDPPAAKTAGKGKSFTEYVEELTELTEEEDTPEEFEWDPGNGIGL